MTYSEDKTDFIIEFKENQLIAKEYLVLDNGVTVIECIRYNRI